MEPHRAAGLVPGRVALEHRGGYVVLTEHREVPADVAGRLRHDAASRVDLPAVGDWVALRAGPEGAGARATIHAVLARRTAFVRAIAGGRTEPQVVAANVDVVLLVAALDGDFNVRRLERYLTIARQSGAEPAIVLTKTDLAPDLDACLAEVRAVAPGIVVHAVSGLTGDGVSALAEIFRGHRTAALIGSSGTGKSTLVNRLVGTNRLAVSPIGVDGRGQHTTTHRELVVLPTGGLILDTPGMRELRLWDQDGLDETFADIASLAAACRFRDCTHDGEPGCAVTAALRDGELDAHRWASFEKLQRETAALAARKDARAAADARRRMKVITRAARERIREKGR